MTYNKCMFAPVHTDRNQSMMAKHDDTNVTSTPVLVELSGTGLDTK